MESTAKRMKIEEPSLELDDTAIQCKHYVQRKKRFCKMTVAKGKEYCGEHEPIRTETTEYLEENDRIPCPLDAKHSVYRKNLKKHLKICNAKEPDSCPVYIQRGVNSGSDCEDERSDCANLKLGDVDKQELDALIEKLEKLYETHVHIDDMHSSHAILADELKIDSYGHETRKHLIQTASILGALDELSLLKDSTSYIEFGAGKGQVSFWLAKALETRKQSKIILLDRASLRHKKDNKLESEMTVQRIRADICDFVIDKLELIKDSTSVIGVSKHLCGAATDLTIRCILKSVEPPKTEAFIIAVCCHHRCEWKSFVGKEFFARNALSRRDFVLITKMASYAICGSGLSRERRKLLEKKPAPDAEYEAKPRLSLERREMIGKMCKRVLDFARLEFLNANGFECSLKYYVPSDVTLENVCIVGRRKREQ